jgi:hypothetical protein
MFGSDRLRKKLVSAPAQRAPTKDQLAEEDGEEDDRFGEGHGDDRLDQYLGGGFRVASNRFASFEANQTNAQRHSKGGGSDVNLSGDFCEEFKHDVIFVGGCFF